MKRKYNPYFDEMLKDLAKELAKGIAGLIVFMTTLASIIGAIWLTHHIIHGGV